MTLKDVLREIINTIEGGACAAVFRLDGEAIEVQVSDPGLAVERIGADLGMLSKVSSYAARKLTAGPVEYCVIAAEKYILLLSAVEIDYALVIGLRQGGNLGKARLQMKKNLDRVAQQLRQLVP